MGGHASPEGQEAVVGVRGGVPTHGAPRVGGGGEGFYPPLLPTYRRRRHPSGRLALGQCRSRPTPRHPRSYGKPALFRLVSPQLGLLTCGAEGNPPKETIPPPVLQRKWAEGDLYKRHKGTAYDGTLKTKQLQTRRRLAAAPLAGTPTAASPTTSARAPQPPLQERGRALTSATSWRNRPPMCPAARCNCLLAFP